VGLLFGVMVGMWFVVCVFEWVGWFVLLCMFVYLLFVNGWLEWVVMVCVYGIGVVVDVVVVCWFIDGYCVCCLDVVVVYVVVMSELLVEGYVGCCEVIVVMDLCGDFILIIVVIFVVVGV